MVRKIENIVDNPAKFCSILILKPKNKCTTILRGKQDIWEQINEIATAWFDSQTDPMWKTIVKALILLGKQGEAKKLAEGTGVDYDKAEEEAEEE